MQKQATKNLVLKNIEYSFLDPAATINMLEQFCNTAVEKNATVVTVPPLFIKKAQEYLPVAGIKVSTVIGYPFGWSAIEAKVAETILAMIDGADELEVVINMLALKNSDWQYLAKELNTLLTVVRKQQKAICFIIPANQLTKDELVKCCDLYGVAGVDGISLSTGLEALPPILEQVTKARELLAEKVLVKVTAVLDEKSSEGYWNAGADRLSVFVK